MISVRLFKDSEGKVHSFRVSGHAGFSAKGTDIVCSAVSFLVINTINSIERFTDEAIEAMADEKEGVIECVFPKRIGNIFNKEADVLIKSMIFGLETLAEEYKENIKISEEAPKCLN